MGLDRSGLLPTASTLIDRYSDKNDDEDIEQTYRDYKKFRTAARMTVLGEEGREPWAATLSSNDDPPRARAMSRANLEAHFLG
jgi:hypothetical protein